MNEPVLLEAFGATNLQERKPMNKLKLYQALNNLKLSCTETEVEALFKDANLLEEGRSLTFIEFKLAVLKAALSLVRMRRVFEEIDQPKKTRVDEKQLRRYHASSGITLASASEFNFSKEFKDCDRNHNSYLNFEEFQLLVFRMTLGPQNIKDLFSKFDKDKDSTISKTEFFHALRRMGAEPSVEQALLLLKECDLNGDGRLSSYEFELFLLRLMRGDPKLSIKCLMNPELSHKKKQKLCESKSASPGTSRKTKTLVQKKCSEH